MVTIIAFHDGSEFAQRMLPHAVRLAGAARKRLLVVRILNPRTDLADVKAPTTGDAASTAASRWEAELRDALSAAGGDGEVSVEQLHRDEDVPSAILRVAAERDAAAVALGTHGAGLARHLLVGSTALGVLAKADLPVLVVGPNVEEPADVDGYRLLVCSDGTESSDVVVDRLSPLLSGSAISVRLLTLYQPRLGDQGPEAEREALRRHLADLASRLPEDVERELLVEDVVDLESLDHAILRVAAQQRAAAVAMSTHGYSLWRHLVSGSVAVGVLQHGTIPALLVRAP